MVPAMETLAYGQAGFEVTILGRLVLAGILGALIGLEREIHGRPAGFRTHLLVTIGACLMMIVSEYFFLRYGGLDSTSAVRLDPARVAAQIVTGIGFLGAGAIVKESQVVRGLTTAACLWVAAGLGMAVGAGLYVPALVVTGIALFSLLFLKRAERFLKKDRYRNLTVYCLGGDRCLLELEETLGRWQLRVVNFGIENDLSAGLVRYDFVVIQYGQSVTAPLAEAISHVEGVKKVRIR